MRRSWKTCWLGFLAAALCLAVAGCSSTGSSCIDPSGEHVMTPPAPPPYYNAADDRYFDDPMGRLPYDDVAVQIRPQEMVAPVGTEVILIAGVCGPDGYLRTNRRLEWTIAPGSVGHFVAIEKGEMTDLLLGDFNRPHIVNGAFAIGSTSRTNIRLNRGECRPEEDKFVRRGEGWISVFSPIEGTSNVTVVAPEVYSWSQRTKTAMVHWIDATILYPPAAINSAGTRHVFTTTVTRHSNQSPCEGWRVRYEIADGPAAGFGADGAPSAEAPTNAAGQASIEIFQKQPAHGTNRVNIQVFRPGDLPGAGGRKLMVGTGATTATWTAPDLALHVSALATANLGATLSSRIDVSNPGDLPTKDLVVTDAVPDGLTFVSANPPPEAVGRQLRWQLGELGARQQRSIEITFRADRLGSVTNCCEAVADGGLRVSDCAATTILAAGAPMPPTSPPLPGGTSRASVQVTMNPLAQDAVPVGGQATFEITVTNRGSTTAQGLRIKDRFDSGLSHAADEGGNLIDRNLGDMAPGQSRRIAVKFNVTRPGRLCHTVEVTGANIDAATVQGCLTAVGSSSSTSPSLPGSPSLPPSPGGFAPPSLPTTPTVPSTPLELKVTASPSQLVVGDTARFVIEVTNKGMIPLRNVKVIDRFDASLEPAMATDGYRIEDRSLVWIADSVSVGASVRYEIQCKCAAAAANACNWVSATLPDGAKVEGKACVEVRTAGVAPPTAPELPRPKPAAPMKPNLSATSADGLILSVVGLVNAIPTGKTMTYEVRVLNIGATVHRQLTLRATVPDGMIPVPLGTLGPDSARFKLSEQVICFDPAPELRPGQTLAYRIRACGRKAGQHRFRVEITGPGLKQPKTGETETEVFGRGDRS